MALVYSQLEQRVTILTHKSSGIVTESDRFAMANMALDHLLGDVDLFESKRFSVLDPALFTDVWDYSLPTDLKADSIIDIRSIGDERRFVYEKKPNVAFDFEARSGRGLPDFSIEADRGTRYIRINSYETETRKQPINAMDSLTDNGTWSANVATSDATNLVVNTQNFKNGGASLQFDILVAQSASNFAEIRNSTMAAVDLTDFQNVGAIFFWVYLPSATNVTSWTLRIGSDASNYFEATVTTNHQGASFQDGENLIRIDWSDFTTVGSPVITAIDFALVRVNYSVSQANMFGVLVDDIIARIGKFHRLMYYSQNVVQTASGTFQRSFSVSTDTSLMLPETEAMFVHLWAYYIDASRREGSAGSWFEQYQVLKEQYLGKYPSERAILGFEYARNTDPNSWSGIHWI